MKFYFCESCGKRITEDDLAEGKGKDKKLSGVYCQNCAIGVTTLDTLPMTDSEAKRLIGSSSSKVSSVTRDPKPSSGVGRRISSKRIPSASTSSSRRRRISSDRLPAVEGVEDGEKKPPPYPLLGALGGFLVVGVVFIFAMIDSGDKPPVKKVVKAKKKREIPPDLGPIVPSKGRNKNGGDTNSDPRNGFRKREPQEKRPANTTVTTPATGVNKPEKKTVTKPEEIDKADVVQLRKRLVESGMRPSREDLRRLCQLPPPDEPQRIDYSIDFSGANGKDEWRGDYRSKISVTEVAGERALKVEQGKGRHACYRLFNLPVNRTRVRMRIYQEGCKKTQFSIQTRLGVRFNGGFPLPEEGEWIEMEVNICEFKHGDLKLENLKFQHIEVHGIPDKSGSGFFALSKFAIISGGGGGEATGGAEGVASVGKPEPPPPPARDEKAETRAAFATFEDEVLALLRARDVDGVRARIEQAIANPLVKDHADVLATERMVLAWFPRIDAAARKGLLKANDLDAFELKLIHGRPLQVGRRADNQVQSIQGGNLMVGNKGMALPVPIENLHRDTWDRAALLGCKGDGPGLVLRAWLQLLTKDLQKEDGAAKVIGRSIDRARAAKAPDADVALLSRKLVVAEHGARELAAAEAWKEAQARDTAEEWKLLLAGLRVMRKAYAETRFVTEKTKEIDALFSKAEDAVGKAEGYYFDFEDEESVARFKKHFRAVNTKNLERKHEGGAMCFRMKEEKDSRGRASGAMALRSTLIRFGENWDLDFKVHLFLTPKILSDGEITGTVYFNVCFAKPAALLGIASESQHRVHLSIQHGHGGFFTCALRGPGQRQNGTGKPGVFKDAGKYGISGGSYFKDGKAREPTRDDGWCHVLMRKRGDKLEVTLNEKLVVDAKLSDEARALLAESTVNLVIGTSGTAKEAKLDEIVYRNRND